ncbi:integral membrane protein GPR155 isoform X2 [Aplysia californica]|uniref:Integral membrane protein GPR155 isoform X2 n=1 Tax=Aplysia californica TaxID=6500 RepID=A0ABM0K276_APLCA|nr:integral membrane protein GPR155 isoform X2 [Aplysia californica]
MADGVNPESSNASSISFDHLYQAILQCFVIILFGYVAGRASLISAVQSTGIGTFVSKFCLPALLFKNMCELQFSEVNWMFLVGILIAKVSVFILIALVTLLVKRPLNLGYAGIFGIFGTQSNDFALGYPIVQALYGETHPEYLKYIYLAAPISLVLLNPIGFTLMEVHRHRTVREESQGSGIGTAILHVLRGVVLNPIVFMTAVGVAGNFVFSGTVPEVLDNFLTVLGQAYNASALFYLGLSMVGKVKSQLGIGLVVPVLLITAKTLILPLITWEVVGWLEPNSNTTTFSMYGFLYGTFPSAPSVFLYASDYGVAQDVVATGLVLGTFLSAPLMFVSAKMMTLMVETGMDYKDQLTSASFDVSIISIICCVWVTGVFVASGKWRRIPHKFTICLMFSHVISCVGMIAFYANTNSESWHHYPITVTLLVGVFASRCWTAVIALVMCLLHVRSLCFVLKMQIWFYFAGFGIPIFITGVLFMVGSHRVAGEIDPSFHYGSLQTGFSLAILMLTVTITITSLVVWQRAERSHLHCSADYAGLHEEQNISGSSERLAASECDQGAGVDESHREFKDLTNVTSRSDAARSAKNYQTYNKRPSLKKASSIEDIIPSPGAQMSNGNDSESHLEVLENVSERTCLLGQCSSEQRHECMDRLRTYTATTLINGDSPQEEEAKTMQEMNKEEYQTAHHLVMLLLLLLSMFIGLFLCIWRIFESRPSGIYVEIEFLDSVFNFGQGFLILTVFGFDTRLVFSPLIRRLRRLMFGAEVLHLPKMTELDSVTRQTCQQFTDYHKENCSRDIVKERKFRFRTFKGVFTGAALCDWLIRIGLADDRDSAIAYGRRLILGRVITHINSEQQFHDAPYFYKFLDTFEYMTC